MPSRTARQRVERFAICIDDGGYYKVSLERWKVYQVLEDADAEAHGQYRVIDESGEDYLYPQEYFSLIELPAPVASLYRSSRPKLS
jgi:hypothetical protein